MISVEEINNFPQTIKALDLQVPDGLAILPINIWSAEKVTDLLNAETSSTVRTVLKQGGISEMPITQKKIPELALKSFDWIGPVIFFASTLITQNPSTVDLTIELIRNFLEEWFKGILKEERNAELTIVTQNKSGSYSKIQYSGDIEGLTELPKIIRSTHDEH